MSKKNNIDSELLELNKLKSVAPDYLVGNKVIYSEYLGFLNGTYGSLCGIFPTNTRLLFVSIQTNTKTKLFRKPKVVSEEINVGSVFYDNIENVQIQNDSDSPFSDLIFILKGKTSMNRLTLKNNDANKLYYELNQAIMGNLNSFYTTNTIYDTPQEDNNSNNKVNSNDKNKKIVKDLTKNLCDKTLQASKWGAKQIKNKGNKIIQDLKDKND